MQKNVTLIENSKKIYIILTVLSGDREFILLVCLTETMGSHGLFHSYHKKAKYKRTIDREMKNVSCKDDF